MSEHGLREFIPYSHEVAERCERVAGGVYANALNIVLLEGTDELTMKAVMRVSAEIFQGENVEERFVEVYFPNGRKRFRRTDIHFLVASLVYQNNLVFKVNIFGGKREKFAEA